MLGLKYILRCSKINLYTDMVTVPHLICMCPNFDRIIIQVSLVRGGVGVSGGLKYDHENLNSPLLHALWKGQVLHGRTLER